MEQVLPYAAPERPQTQGRLILLTLVVTFPFLAMLVIEQGKVIDSQRTLIHQLSRDSQELSRMKGIIRSHRAPASQAEPTAPDPQVAPKPPRSTAPHERAGAARNSPHPHRPQRHRPAPPAEEEGPRIIDMTRLKAV